MYLWKETLMDTINPANAEGRLDAYARRFGVSPLKFRRMLVGEFCRDITAEILGIAERVQRLEELLSLVSPARAEKLTDSLTPYFEELLTVQEYLHSLRLDPMAWPGRQ